MNSSPGAPSSYMPTVRYPSCPATSNLWVIDCRVLGILRRNGAGVTARAGSKHLGEVSFNVEEFVPERMEVEATVAETRRDLDRSTRLVERNFAAQSELDKAQAA